jgi:hypothetical protein
MVSGPKINMESLLYYNRKCLYSNSIWKNDTNNLPSPQSSILRQKSVFPVAVDWIFIYLAL